MGQILKTHRNLGGFGGPSEICTTGLVSPAKIHSFDRCTVTQSLFFFNFQLSCLLESKFPYNPLNKVVDTYPAVVRRQNIQVDSCLCNVRWSTRTRASHRFLDFVCPVL